MTGDYKITRASRQCAVSKRALEPGEVFFSVVVEVDDGLHRQDIASEHWDEPPENALGWWRNRVPVATTQKRQIAPPEVLIELLRTLGDHAERSDSRYLLALMCLRKRIVKMRASTSLGRGRSLSSEDIDETLQLESTLDGSPLDVAVVPISAARADILHEELDALMHIDAP
ncbi:MAG: hypothetical protein AAF539_05560 [Planctomycetota bacterium]